MGHFYENSSAQSLLVTVTLSGNWKSFNLSNKPLNVSLYYDNFYYKKVQFGIKKSVTVTNRLLNVTL